MMLRHVRRRLARSSPERTLSPAAILAAIAGAAVSAAVISGVALPSQARCGDKEGRERLRLAYLNRSASAFSRALDCTLPVDERQRALYDLGMAHRDDGSLTDALTVWNQTLMELERSDERAPILLTHIAEVAAQLGLWELASMHWRAAAALRPDDLSALSNAASALLNVRTVSASRRAVPLLRTLLDRLSGTAGAGAGAGASEQGLSPSRAQALARLAVALLLSRKDGVGEGEGDADGALRLLRRLEEGVRAPTVPEEAAEYSRAAVFVAFALETRSPSLARQLLLACVSVDDASLRLGAQASAVFYRLGALLRRNGQADEERSLYRAAVAQRVWELPDQRPGYHFAGLLARPWHSVEELSALSTELAAAVTSLEAQFRPVRAEILGALSLAAADGAASDVPAHVAARAGVSVRDDDEDIADAGRWRQMVRLPPCHGVPWRSVDGALGSQHAGRTVSGQPRPPEPCPSARPPCQILWHVLTSDVAVTGSRRSSRAMAIDCLTRGPEQRQPPKRCSAACSPVVAPQIDCQRARWRCRSSKAGRT